MSAGRVMSRVISDRALVIAAAVVAIVLWTLYAGISRAEPLPDQIIERLRSALAERDQRIDDYEQTQVMRCAEGELVLSIDDSAAAGEAVYDYNGVSGCRYLLLPEPGVGTGLALGALCLAGSRYRRRPAEGAAVS